jgi:hypothetical protein
MTYNYYTYEKESFTCPKCNWNGLGSDTLSSEANHNGFLRDIECPNCEEVLYTFDLKLPIVNPKKDEKVCFNCINMLWMVGAGQGVKCSLTMKNIPNRYYTCDQFENKFIDKDNS